MNPLLRDSTPSLSTSVPWTNDEVGAIHGKCGIYTKDRTAETLLDWIGWSAQAELGNATLLEPSCGDGALLAPAIQRLCRSLVTRGVKLSKATLLPRIRACEFHASEAEKARQRVQAELASHGVAAEVAREVAVAWVRVEDFLIGGASDATYTHVVANPPYVRWSALPTRIARAYESALPCEVARGDLCLAFMHRMLMLAKPGAPIGLLASDRWLYASYAESFRGTFSKDFAIEKQESVLPYDVFHRRVSAYPAMFLLRRREPAQTASSFIRRGDASVLFQRWSSALSSIETVGCRIRVGPALGCDAAFLLPKGNLRRVEKNRRARFVGPKEIVGDAVKWTGRSVVTVHEDGELISLSEFPKTSSHLAKHKKALVGRSCVSDDASDWYRTIDRISVGDWQGPKLLVPELAKKPRIALDSSGLIPSHGIYAVFSDEWPIKILYSVLASGVLGATLEAVAPKVNGGCLRCYKRFIARIPLPRWSSLPENVRAELGDADSARVHAAVAKLYAVHPHSLAAHATAGWQERLVPFTSASKEGASLEADGDAAGRSRAHRRK